MKLLSIISVLLATAFTAVAAEPVQYIAPTVKEIDNVATKVARKASDPDEAELRSVLIKRAIETYLASPAASTPFDDRSAATAADSIKALKLHLRNSLATLAALDHKVDEKESDIADNMESLYTRRDSLLSVLASIEARRASLDSMSAHLNDLTATVNDSISALQSLASRLERDTERASRIKDAAHARRSQTLSILDQLSTLETRALRRPLDEDFSALYSEASALLERNRAMIANYGTPARMAEAEAAVAHISRLKEFSTLVAEGNAALKAKYEPSRVTAVASRLDTMYREHGLDNRDHIDTVRSLIRQLRDMQPLYDRFIKALNQVAGQPDGWLFPDDTASFNLIVDGIGDIPAEYPRFREAKAALVSRLPGSGKTVVRGADLDKTINDIKNSL